MKKLKLLLLAMVLCLAANSQVPEAINYQMLVRGTSGEILADTELSIKFSILQGSPDGSVVYSEIHEALSNQFGMVDLAIGAGLPEQGEFSRIQWAEDQFYLQIMINFEGKDDYQHYGTQQLLTVPYAFSAKEAEHANSLSLYVDGKEYLVKVDENGALYTELGGCDPLYDMRDGQTYQTVRIGEQCWMAQNLNFQTNNSWCYSNDTANCDIYGRLYDHEAALNACPEGWKLPGENDWCVLTTFLDATVDCNVVGITGTDVGGKMKDVGTLEGDGLWAAPNTSATNESGFTALPGGFKHGDFFWDIGANTSFWSATASGQDWSYYRRLTYENAEIFRLNESDIFGFSVRCVKDEE